MMTQQPAYSVPPELWKSYELLQAAIDSLEDPFFVKDLYHRMLVTNQANIDLVNMSRETLIGRPEPEYLQGPEYEGFWRVDDEVFSTSTPRKNEEVIPSSDGTAHHVWTRKFPIKNAEGQVIGLVGTITDISEIKRRQEEIERLEAEINEKRTVIEAQAAMIDQLAVPVIQVWQGILLLPLIGMIDSRRATQVMENMLEAIGRTQSEFVILDITGVPVVDTAVASYLLRSVQAAQLLGAQCMLVGISPEIAQTLVGLGVDFSQIMTRASLQNGLEYAMRRLNQTTNTSNGNLKIDTSALPR
jgi:rsbT co-antagonist protein RsbR